MRLMLTACLALIGACTTPDGGPDASAAPEEITFGDGPLDLTLGENDPGCDGTTVRRGGQGFLLLDDGSLLTLAPLDVSVAGSPVAFHPQDRAAGALAPRCLAGEAVLPTGTAFEGGRNEASCARFERQARLIEAAGWRDGTAGAVRWHGIEARGSAVVRGRRVPRAEPIVQGAEDPAPGFYVSRTALSDEEGGGWRYVDSGTVPYAVTRRDQDVPLGSYGVAFKTSRCVSGRCVPVPFVVGDHGPRVGRGSMALARAVSGLEPTIPTSDDRRDGLIGRPEVLTVFFGGERAEPPYDEEAVKRSAGAAFDRWGGEARLRHCLRAYVPTADEETG